MTIMGTLENTMQHYMGIDYISLSVGSLHPYKHKEKITEEYYNISMGKYLFPNFMSILSYGLNNSEFLYGFQYDIRRDFDIKGWRYKGERGDGDYYFGAEYRYRF